MSPSNSRIIKGTFSSFHGLILLLIMILPCICGIFFIMVHRRPIVSTSSGELRGGLRFLSSMYAFKGIPYAEPPVGDLRFRNPVSHKGWTGVRDASKHGHKCPTIGYALGIARGGDEDCLFLNVYAPYLNGSLPVMVWIHGGSFVHGDGDDFIYGPDLIVKEGVIVVTFNYRLGSLGFLSTGDKNAQGNYGLKDMMLALKWVRKNIAAFGGNPDKITVFGASAGAIAIHLMLLSGKHKGLFDQAIMQSGTALAPFALQTNPLKRAEDLAHRLGLQFNSTESLMEGLRAVNYMKLIKAERKLAEMDLPLALRPFDFFPCVEPSDSLEEILLTDEPINLMLKEDYKNMNIPIIIGTTSNEGLFMIRSYIKNRKIFDEYNQDDSFLVPLSFNLSKNSSSVKEVADEFKSMYFNGQNLSKQIYQGFAQYHTDAQFKFPLERTLKVMAQNSTKPIYYYNFNYAGAYNFVKSFLFLENYPGVCHGDDVLYLFRPKIPIPVWPTNHALTVRKRYIKLFTNFAKYGNPTPSTDGLIKELWPQFSLENEEYMDIGYDLKVKQHCNKERLQTWHDFQKRFTGHL